MSALLLYRYSRLGGLGHFHELGHADHDKLRRPDGGNPHVHVQIALGHGLRRIVTGIDFDVKRLRRGFADQGAVAPLGGEKTTDLPANLAPKLLTVGLKHRPVQALFDGLFNKNHQAANIDVLPERIQRQGARAPHTDTGIGEVPDRIDAIGIELGLVTGGDRRGQHRGEIELAHVDAGRGFVDADGLVGVGVDTGDEARGR